MNMILMAKLSDGRELSFSSRPVHSRTLLGGPIMSDSNISPKERWLAIPGWEGIYSVSDKGRVRRESSRVVNWRMLIIKLRGSKRGYITTCLRLNGIAKQNT